jgi:uncharacterized protein (TIGR02118 family)
VKILLSVAFDGDRATFVDAMLPSLESVVATGEASKATLDARAADADIEPFGPDLMRPLEMNAVVALWDAEPDSAVKLELPAIARLVGAYHVDEVVQKDYERSWPSGTESPGIKMIAFLHRRGDLTHDQFSQHWRNNHGPLAVARQPGFWHYVQNHVVERLTDGTPDWDGVGEIHCRSVDDALHRSYDSEEAQQLIWEDVARFLDYETSPTLVTKEWVVDQRQ